MNFCGAVLQGVFILHTANTYIDAFCIFFKSLSDVSVEAHCRYLCVRSVCVCLPVCLFAGANVFKTSKRSKRIRVSWSREDAAKCKECMFLVCLRTLYTYSI